MALKRNGMSARTFTTIQVMILVGWLPMFAQPKKVAPVVPAYSQIQFDPNTLRVPPHFMGNDIVRLYKAFAALHDAEKAEFETTDQFNKRIELAEAKLFMGSKTETATLSFVIPVKAEYDADSEMLIVQVYGGPDRDNASSVRVKQSKRESSHIGSNAFGAKIAVHDTYIHSYFLLINNTNQFTNADLSIAVKMLADEARKIKGTLSALAVCTITKGDIQTDKDVTWKKPTFDDPHEVFEQLWFLRTNLLAIWLFDSSSGKVHTKVEPTEVAK